MEELPVEEIRGAEKDDPRFRRVYNHYAPFLWRVIYRTVHGNELLAEQILQNVFITVHRTLRRFRFESAFSTWLYQIAWRESLRMLKREKRNRERHRPLQEDMVASKENGSVQEEIDSALKKLTDEERFLLVSREVDGFSFEELADITGKSSGSLRTAVSRIKQKLREVSHG